MTDWRLPAHRREAFLRFYAFHLEHRAHPGMVYSWLPAIADHLNADDDQRAWIVWLNANTQNPVTTLLLLQQADHPARWRKVVDFWNKHFVDLQWDTDRRHQKSKFGEATERWAAGRRPGDRWRSLETWPAAWNYATSLPYMGRLSAWSMIEYARILFGPAVPDAPTMLLGDKAGSRSHRNGLALVDGYDSTFWGVNDTPVGLYTDLEILADELLADVTVDSTHAAEGISRLSLESALCTYKGWHKPRRRYPGVYADMAYDRLLWAEARHGRRFDVLWDARERDLPEYLRLEASPYDPGCVPAKQDHYRLTGQPVMMERTYHDMQSEFRWAVDAQRFGVRKDWEEDRWT